MVNDQRGVLGLFGGAGLRTSLLMRDVEVARVPRTWQKGVHGESVRYLAQQSTTHGDQADFGRVI